VLAFARRFAFQQEDSGALRQALAEQLAQTDEFLLDQRELPIARGKPRLEAADFLLDSSMAKSPERRGAPSPTSRSVPMPASASTCRRQDRDGA
jgi:hypothetical protein